MKDVLILDKKTLRRIPPVFTLFFILLLGFPAIALTYFGLDFGGLSQELHFSDEVGVSLLEAQIRNYFIQVLLQWSAFSLAAITVLMAFTQYRLADDKIALIIGLTILFSGSVEALHTLVFDGPPYLFDKDNVDALVWTFTNTGSGLILMIGLWFLLIPKKIKRLRITTFTLLSIFLFVAAFGFIYYAAFVISHPAMYFKDAIIARPYELMYIFLYLIILFVFYPPTYKKYPNILTNCIFYISVAQIVIATYFIFLQNFPTETAYNIAFFLKIVLYFLPFSCLVINYIFSYNASLEAQYQLQMGQNKLEYIASHDDLTNLYNRREFEHILDGTIAINMREKEQFALFLIDIDNFKSINDTLGHIYGDYFLKQFSEQLQNLTRKGEVVSRIGGDEFAIITSRIKSMTSARKLAERLLKGLNIPYQIHDKLLSGTVSIGISTFPIDGEGTDELLKKADIAMYNAKNSGKNTYQFYTKKFSSIQHREAEIESHLRTALAEDELTLVYQPQYNLITKEIIGAEILLRWHSKKLGTVAPDEFIPVAENSNLIITIGDWVLQKTCEQTKYWAEKYKRYLHFSINVSPIQFANSSFYTHFKKTLEAYQYPSQYLGIEITENLLMKEDEIVTNSLQKFGELGVNISLDDFGKGYSSLSRLQSLPINTVKIDKSFIADISEDSEKVSIVDMIIKLTKELEMKIIAEGIETVAQLNYLILKECIFGQGFLLNRPINAENFEKLAYIDNPYQAPPTNVIDA